MRQKNRYFIGVLRMEKGLQSKLQEIEVLQEIRVTIALPPDSIETGGGPLRTDNLIVSESPHELCVFFFGFTVVQFFDGKTGVFCLRCGHKMSEEVMGTLIYTKSIQQMNASFELVATRSTAERAKEVFDRQLALESA